MIRDTLKIHNSLTGAKQELQPRVPGKLGMYVCGITVYDYCHIGHARMVVVFDMVARWLRVSGFDLTYVRNITDVDDKIIKRAQENGEPVDRVTERFIDAMNEDFAPLGVLRPDQEPRATLSMDDIVTMIGKLIANGHAYEGGNGDVYFDVSSFDGYGKLSGKDPADLRAGARIEINEAKQDPLDFVLWKRAKEGEPSWPSPWGDGRPGWHIECSAMATRCLGDNFDIHGGGVDLKFPHHENEIAQSEGATGVPFVNLWMHNGFVQVDNEKMSKSLGNFFTIREVLQRYRGEEIRAFILMSHYRSPVNFSDQQLDGARAALERLYTALRGTESRSIGALPQVEEDSGSDARGSDARGSDARGSDARGSDARGSDPMVANSGVQPNRNRVQRDAPTVANPYRDRFEAAMNDDFNTPIAFAVLFDLAREVNRLRDTDPAAAAAHAGLLRELGGILGFLQDDPDAFLRGDGRAGTLDTAAIEAMIEDRNAARARKDFAASDRIRDELKAKGVLLEDSAAGTTWRRT